jgi:polar amino acid transport system substrate-binding protein
MIICRNPHMLLIASLVLLLLPTSLHAEEVLTASPYWQGFTSADGQGLYHDLMRAIYGPGGNTVRHLEVPAKRGLIMVREGAIDIYTCRSEPADGLELAREPMYEGEYHALFRKDAVPFWEGVSSMANRRVTWRLGYYSPQDFPVPVQQSETSSGTEALERVVRGGADFYVDDFNLITESMRAFKAPLDDNDYRIESVGFRQYFPVFSVSERGRSLRRIYEEGMRSLANQGRLAPIYEKWDLPMPRTYQK